MTGWKGLPTVALSLLFMKKLKYLVSACLAGYQCRYDGNSSPDERIISLVKNGEAIPFCPEELGGLPTPRPSCEIVITEGIKKVKSIKGDDFTDQFIAGAEKSLQLAFRHNITKAIMKSGSPSCGYGQVYDGLFSGRKISGNGIAADLLHKNGIKIYNELNFNIENIKKD